MTIWMVVRWHNPYVSHGYEPEALFLSELPAARYADRRNERAGIVPAPDGVAEGECEVQVWEVEA